VCDCGFRITDCEGCYNRAHSFFVSANYVIAYNNGIIQITEPLHNLQQTS
jgi:hypothetical protein